MFSEAERRIFQYFDGAGAVWGDPLALERALLSCLGPDAGRVLEEANSPDNLLALAATGQLVEGIRTAFSMVPFDPSSGAGATEAMCLDALEALYDCLDAKKKPAVNLPISPPPTASFPDPLTMPALWG